MKYLKVNIEQKTIEIIEGYRAGIYLTDVNPKIIRETTIVANLMKSFKSTMVPDIPEIILSINDYNGDLLNIHVTEESFKRAIEEYRKQKEAV
jgi:hypothetical protein